MRLRHPALTFALLAAAIGVVGYLAGTLLAPATDPTTTQRPAITAGQAMETAVERRARLLPEFPASPTPMAIPSGALDIRTQLIGSHKHSARPDGYTPVAVVIHATGSGQPGSEFASLAHLRSYFATSHREASAHYAVDREGRVLQMVRDERKAWHVATPGWNTISIGIELLNDNSGTQPFTGKQLAAARELVQTLGQRWQIPVEAVVRHREVQPEDRRDPADNFPWNAFLASLAA